MQVTKQHVTQSGYTGDEQSWAKKAPMPSLSASRFVLHVDVVENVINVFRDHHATELIA